MRKSNLYLSIMAAVLFVAQMSMNLNAQVCTGTFTLSTQAEVDAFSCTSVTGGLIITGAGITDLTPLSGLTSVSFLMVNATPDLTSLDGLEDLATAPGSVVIYNATALTSIEQLSNITTTGALQIAGNSELLSLEGLHNLTSVTGPAYVYYNYKLENLDGLRNLTTVGYEFIVQWNNVLNDLSGLTKLTTVGGDFTVADHFALTSLNGLDAFTDAAHFIADNNQLLDEYCSLYAYVEAGGTITATDNAINPTAQDIIDGGPCQVCDFFTVQLKNSNGDLLAGGSLEYREGGGSQWQSATEISDGVFCIDTQRSQVGLRMTYGPQIQKEGAVPTNSVYTFQTVNVTVELKDTETPIDGGVVDYTSDGWHAMGTTGDNGANSGSVSMEMLPLQYTFRMEYNGDKENKTELISSGNNLISFQLADLKSGELNDAKEFQLAAYPNPFSDNATIAFSIEKTEEVTVSVFDVNGKLVEVLQEGIMEQGMHKLIWNANKVQNGVYLVRFSSNGQVYHRNMVKL